MKSLVVAMFEGECFFQSPDTKNTGIFGVSHEVRGRLYDAFKTRFGLSGYVAVRSEDPTTVRLAPEVFSTTYRLTMSVYVVGLGKGGASDEDPSLLREVVLMITEDFRE